MRFAVLGSGSQGNGTLVAHDDTYVLVDCGFSLRETERRLLRLGVHPTQLSAILVTHEHADHVHGVGLLSRRYNLPVYLSRGTLRGMRKPIEPAGFLAGGEQLQIGALSINVVAVAHDAQELAHTRALRERVRRRQERLLRTKLQALAQATQRSTSQALSSS